jgi:hypothetical protein
VDTDLGEMQNRTGKVAFQKLRNMLCNKNLSMEILWKLPRKSCIIILDGLEWINRNGWKYMTANTVDWAHDDDGN